MQSNIVVDRCHVTLTRKHISLNVAPEENVCYDVTHSAVCLCVFLQTSSFRGGFLLTSKTLDCLTCPQTPKQFLVWCVSIWRASATLAF